MWRLRTTRTAAAPTRPAAAAGLAVDGRRLSLFERWDQASRQLDRLLGSLGREPDFAARCGAFADQLVALVAEDPGRGAVHGGAPEPRPPAALGPEPRAALRHPVPAGRHPRGAGQRRAWASLVRAALTMNLAIVDVQGLFARMGRITEGQRDRIQAHPQAAHDRLREAGVTDPEWLRAVLEHHERTGGGGYPEGLAQPGEAAGALRMVDTFLSSISPRTGRPALPIQEAVKQLYASAQGHTMAVGILKEFGIVPPRPAGATGLGRGAGW